MKNAVAKEFDLVDADLQVAVMKARDISAKLNLADVSGAKTEETGQTLDALVANH